MIEKPPYSKISYPSKTLNGLQDQTFRLFGENMDGLHPQRICCHHRLRNIKSLFVG
jgi:hypothetical protein